MLLYVDSREQWTQDGNTDRHIPDYLDRHGINYTVLPLKTGDYMLPGGKVSVDRKQSLQEVSQNLFAKNDRSRFWREIRRSKEQGIHLYILIEETGFRAISDVAKWKSRYGKVKGRDLAEEMFRVHISYNVDFVFCSPTRSAAKIMELLKGEIMSKHIDIYCDGCSLNNGTGNAVAAWGAVLLCKDGDKELGKKEFWGLCKPVASTNNQAEVTAAIESMRKIKPESRNIPVTVHTDSQYLANYGNGEWKNPEKNKELLQTMFEEIGKFDIPPEFVWIKGHAGNEHNERADRLATGFAVKYAKENGIDYEIPKREG